MANSHAAAPGLTTEELAQLLKFQAQTLRKRLCMTGSYFGLKPIRLPNGRLRWPANALEILANGGLK